MFSVFVPGTPIPQGSKICVQNRPIEANPKTKVWRKQLVTVISEAWQLPPLDEPLTVECVFYFDKPQKPKFREPAVKPDVDKLARNCLDALTQSGAIVDDSRVISLHLEKRFVNEWVCEPGVLVTIRLRHEE